MIQMNLSDGHGQAKGIMTRRWYDDDSSNYDFMTLPQNQLTLLGWMVFVFSVLLRIL